MLNQRTIQTTLHAVNQDTAVIRAECMTNFIVQHDLPFSTSDHLIKLFPKMFSDSKIAKQYGCARTKTTCILNGAMMPELKKYLTGFTSDKSNIHSLVNDGSSDTGLKKMNVACTMIFYINRSKTIEMEFFDMRSTTAEDASKASTLFTAINDAMKKCNADWSNSVSIGVDNINSNVGRHNPLSSRILQCNKSTHIAGCSCHLAHLAASKGGAAFIVRRPPRGTLTSSTYVFF